MLSIRIVYLGEDCERSKKACRAPPCMIFMAPWRDIFVQQFFCSCNATLWFYLVTYRAMQAIPILSQRSAGCKMRCIVQLFNHRIFGEVRPTLRELASLGGNGSIK